MSKRLAELVDAIDTHMADPQGDPRAMVLHLIEHEGAALSIGSEMRLTLAGVRATCTWGHHGLLRNWCGLARKRIEQGVPA